MSYLRSQAVQYIEQGHVRVGPDPITDPAFLVTRHMEDFVTWVDTSKLKRTVMQYNVCFFAPVELLSATWADLSSLWCRTSLMTLTSCRRPCPHDLLLYGRMAPAPRNPCMSLDCDPGIVATSTAPQ